MQQLVYEVSVGVTEARENAQLVVDHSTLLDDLIFRLKLADLRHPRRLDHYLSEMTRLTHNWLSSVYTLQERTKLAVNQLRQQVPQHGRDMTTVLKIEAEFREDQLIGLLAHIRGKATHVEPLDLRWENVVDDVTRLEETWYCFVHFNSEQLVRLRALAQPRDPEDLDVRDLATKYIQVASRFQQEIERHLTTAFAQEVADWQRVRPRPAPLPPLEPERE